VHLLVIVWAIGLLAIWAMHAGTGVVVSVYPDDSVESGPEIYARYLQVRPRLINGQGTLSGRLGCTRLGGMGQTPQGMENGPRVQALVPEAGPEGSRGNTGDDVIGGPGSEKWKTVPPL
jgi:hypothetical protein